MRSRQQLDRQHRRVLGVGIALSLIVHVAALAWLRFDGGASGTDAFQVPARSTRADETARLPVPRALQVVRIEATASLAAAASAEPAQPAGPPPGTGEPGAEGVDVQTSAAAEPASAAPQDPAEPVMEVDAAAPVLAAEAAPPPTIAEVPDTPAAAEMLGATIADSAVAVSGAIYEPASVTGAGIAVEEPATTPEAGVSSAAGSRPVHTPGSVGSAKRRWAGNTGSSGGSGRTSVIVGVVDDCGKNPPVAAPPPVAATPPVLRNNTTAPRGPLRSMLCSVR